LDCEGVHTGAQVLCRLLSAEGLDPFATKEIVYQFGVRFEKFRYFLSVPRLKKNIAFPEKCGLLFYGVCVLGANGAVTETKDESGGSRRPFAPQEFIYRISNIDCAKVFHALALIQ